MHDISTRPSKPQRPIAVAIQSSPWPSWAPRPANPDPEGSRPGAAEIHCELPTVDDVKRQAEEASPPHKRGGRSDATLAEQVQLVKTIGRRFREAREDLAGMSQIEAAKQLGYTNSSKLAKIEAASDTVSVPLTTIQRAANLYEVSIDYLFGLSEDWERSPAVCRERQMGQWLHDHLQRERTRDALAFAEMRTMLEAVSAMIPSLANGAENAKAAFERFSDINPCYDDLIGGARLQAAIEALDDAGRKARLALKRLHIELEGTGVAEVQP